MEGQTCDLCLDAKALVQPLGSENCWNELGDGVVELVGHSVRVVCHDRAPSPHVCREDASTTADDSELFPPHASPQIVLEDTITDDTPFVGENCCIVWNSIEQQLSLCIMFMSDQGYAAAWSALHAAQHKPYPPLEFDFLSRCRDGDVPGCNGRCPSPTTYADVICPQDTPPLGFIEKHAIACSIMEFGHGAESALFADVHTCVALLKLCHADLLEYLMSDDVFPNLLRGLESVTVARVWDVPEGLHTLLGEDALRDVSATINTALRLHHLKHEVLPVGADEEVIAVIDSLHHRLHNELICTLLADDALFPKVVEVLLSSSPRLPSPQRVDCDGVRKKKEKRSQGEKKEKKQKRCAGESSASSGPPPTLSVNAIATTDAGHCSGADESAAAAAAAFATASSTLPPCSPHPPSGSPSLGAHYGRPPSRPQLNPAVVVGQLTAEEDRGVEAAAVQVPCEHTIANHLRFLTSFFSIAVAAFAKELMAHLIAKVFEGGLLVALSSVARRFLGACDPPAAAGSPLQHTAAPAAATSVLDNRESTENGGPLLPAVDATQADGVECAPSHNNSSSSNSSSCCGVGDKKRAASVGFAGCSYSMLVEKEMICLLDATITRLNEKAEEGVMTAVFRGPMLEAPDKHAPLLYFLARCLLRSGDLFIGRNSMLLFHLLGLHDDEGSGCERNSDPDLVAARNAFHKHCIEGVIRDLCFGRVMPLPPLEANPRLDDREGVPALGVFGALEESGRGVSGARKGTSNTSLSSTLGISEPHLHSSGNSEPAPSASREAGPSTMSADSKAILDDAQAVCSSQPSPASQQPRVRSPADAAADAADQALSIITQPAPPTDHAPLQAATRTVTPVCIRVLEYLLLLTCEANRELLVSTMLHPRSRVRTAIAAAAADMLSTSSTALRSQPPPPPTHATVGAFSLRASPVGSRVSSMPSATRCRRRRLEDLTGNVRFLRALLQHGGASAIRGCVLEQDVLQPYLQLYCALGGSHKTSLFHSTVLSLLFALHADPRLADCERLLVLRHRTLLPPQFVKICDAAALEELTQRLKSMDKSAVGPPHIHLSPTPSRTATPMSGLRHNAALLDISGGSTASSGGGGGSPRRRSVDEVHEPSGPEAMEEVAAFHPRLRSLIGRLSPTPTTAQSPAPPTADGGPATAAAVSPVPPAHVAPTANQQQQQQQQSGEVNHVAPPPKQPHRPQGGKGGASGTGTGTGAGPRATARSSRLGVRDDGKTGVGTGSAAVLVKPILRKL